MKLWSIAGIVLLLLQLITVPVMADSFTEIPAEHWIYEVFRPLVSKGLISYQVDLGDEFTLSRYEAAMSVAKILEELILISAPEREALQAQNIAALIDQYSYKLDVAFDTDFQRLHYSRKPTLYQTTFGSLDLETIDQIEETVYDTIIRSINQAQIPEYVPGNIDIIKGMFAVAVELYEEINALGFELTAFERDLPTYSALLQNKYVLGIDTPHSSVNVKLTPLFHNPVQLVFNSDRNRHVTLEALEEKPGKLLTTELRLEKIDLEENSKGDDWQLGMGIFQDSFAPYRLIDFAGTPSP